MFEAPDLADHGAPATSQALDELPTAANRPKRLASSFDNPDGKDFGLTRPVPVAVSGAGAATRPS